MIKLIAILASLIPLILFLRALLFRRPSKISAAFSEAKKQIDLGITIFLIIIGCVLAFGVIKLAWTWWAA